MKEAAGEANMTVITILLIAVVLGIGTVVVNRLMTNTERKSCCTQLGGTVNGGFCVVGSTSTQMTDNWLNTNCPEN